MKGCHRSGSNSWTRQGCRESPRLNERLPPKWQQPLTAYCVLFGFGSLNERLPPKWQQLAGCLLFHACPGASMKGCYRSGSNFVAPMQAQLSYSLNERLPPKWQQPGLGF